MMKNLVSATKLAEFVGVSRQTLLKKAREGLLTPAAEDEQGRLLFDLSTAPKQCSKWIARSKRLSRHSPGKDRGGRRAALVEGAPGEEPPVEVDAAQIAGVNFDNGLDFNSLLGDLSKLSEEGKVSRAEFIKKLFDAMQSALKAKEKEGSLMPTVEASKQGARFAALVIGFLNAQPDLLAQRYAVMDDPRDIRDDMIRENNRGIEKIRKFCGAIDEEDIPALPIAEGVNDVSGA